MARILMIDDDLDLLEISKSLLERRGFEVATASNWEIALVTLRIFNPQIILLDVFLAGIDGLDICKKIKSSPDTCHIPVVIVSGYPRIAERVYECGAEAFIPKPFEINDLVSQIHDILSQDHMYA